MIDDDRVGRVGVLPHRLERVDRVVAARPGGRSPRRASENSDGGDRRRESQQMRRGASSRRRLPRLAPVMYEPSSAGVTVGRVELGDDAAPQHHEQRVGQPDQLLEVGRDQQHRRARRRGPRGGCPTPRPARRRRCPGSGGRRSGAVARRSSRGRRSASAGCRRRARTPATSMPGVRTSKSVDDLRGALARPAGRSTAPWRTAAASGGRASRSPTAATAARGRRAGGPPGCSRCPASRRSRVAGVRDVHAPEHDRAARRAAEADQRLEELALAVALDAGDARRSRRGAP